MYNLKIKIMKTKNGMNGKKKMTIELTGSNSRMGKNEPAIETDTKLKLKQFSIDLTKRFHEDGMYNQMKFFLGLSYNFGSNGWDDSPNLKLFKPMLDGYNSFMAQHELMGEVVEQIETPFPKLYSDFSMEDVMGKYKTYDEDGLPQLLFREPETHQQFAEQQIAGALLDFIYELVDIRKIEVNIPELKGLCDYLKKLAPDEFHGYCKLGDQITYNASLNFERCREFLEDIKMESLSEMN